jgi:tubulin-folding cofactor B
MDPLEQLRNLDALHPYTRGVRDYVTGADHLQYTNLPEGIVAVDVTHSNLPAKHLDIRLDLHNTIEQIKDKLRTHIGTPVDYQRLLLRSNGEYVCEMSDNSRMLGFYSVRSGHEIHVVDTDPFSLSKGGGLTDASLIKKYEMSEEDYSKRKGTVREFILKKKAEEDATASTAYGADTVVGIAVMNRCEVMPGSRRGTVMFVGEIPNFKAGHWVGVKFDEPAGKPDFDGKLNGISYFECQPGYGTFVRGNNLTVGDFPEIDIMDENEDEI